MVSLGFVAFDCTKYAFKSSSTADRELPVIANRTVIIVDSNGTAVPKSLKGSAAVVDSAAKAEPAVLDNTTIPKGTAVVVDTDADAEPGILNGTAVAVDSASNADPATLDGNAVAVDSAATPEQAILDGTPVVMVSAADAEQAILDGTAVVVDCDANELHRTTASYGAKAATVVILVAGGAVVGCVALPAAGLGALSLAGFTSTGPAAGGIAASWMSSIAISNGGGVAAGSLYALLQSTAMSGGGWLLGAPVTSTVGAAVGGGLAWLSSKLGRKTTSGNRGCDPGCDVEEKSQERCFACGIPVAAATSLA